MRFSSTLSSRRAFSVVGDPCRELASTVDLAEPGRDDPEYGTWLR